jgi:hypothetical protein
MSCDVQYHSVEQSRALNLQPAAIDAAIVKLKESCDGFTEKPQVAAGFSASLKLVENPDCFAAAGRAGDPQVVTHDGAMQASSWALRPTWSRPLP